MARARSEHSNPIDVLMEEASQELVRRDYFEAERICVDALRAAFASLDFERMARILLPLEEARRQKRDLAFDAGIVSIVDDELPSGKKLVAGCYLVCPPRVGLDGRLLREQADRKKIPAIIVVREPTTRDGVWPIVALGPVTIRTKVPPPPPPTPEPADATEDSKHAGKKPKKTSAKAPADAQLPPPRWFLHANEALGDAAIASIDPGIEPATRVDALLKRLEAHPDHEKLHQALGDACRECVVHIAKNGKTRRPLVASAAKDVAEDDDDLDL